MIALFDVANLPAEEARKVVAETAKAICDRMLPSETCAKTSIR